MKIKGVTAKGATGIASALRESLCNPPYVNIPYLFRAPATYRVHAVVQFMPDPVPSPAPTPYVRNLSRDVVIYDARIAGIFHGNEQIDNSADGLINPLPSRAKREECDVVQWNDTLKVRVVPDPEIIDFGRSFWNSLHLCRYDLDNPLPDANDAVGSWDADDDGVPAETNRSVAGRLLKTMPLDRVSEGEGNDNTDSSHRSVIYSQYLTPARSYVDFPVPISRSENQNYAFLTAGAYNNLAPEWINPQDNPLGNRPYFHDFSDEFTTLPWVIDINVDSDNTNINPDYGPDDTVVEDPIEEDEPGRIVLSNNDDDDGDGVMDALDGFNYDGLSGTPEEQKDDQNADEDDFVRMTLHFHPKQQQLLDEDSKIRIDYNGLKLRVWNAPGNQPRNIVGTLPGNLILPGTAYYLKRLNLGQVPEHNVAVDLWLEGLAPSINHHGDSIIVYYDVDADGVWDYSDTVRVTVIVFGIMNSNLSLSTNHLNIGHWGEDQGTGLNGYNGSTVLNNAGSGNQFIDVDPDRFRIHVQNPSANTSAFSAQTIIVTVATVDGAGGDDPTNITLTETGNNTGAFESEWELLMSPDVHVNADDDLAVWSQVANAFVADDNPEDRTHRVGVDGDVRFRYTIGTGAYEIRRRLCDHCPADGRDVRDLHIHVRVWLEPYTDTGYDNDGDPNTPNIGAGNGAFDYSDANANGRHDNGEASEPFSDINGDGARGGVVDQAYVERQVARANISWAQACIRVIVDGAIEFADAPNNVLGDNDRYDGSADSPEETSVLTVYAPLAHPDVLEIVFAPLPNGINGYTTIAERQNVILSENYFVFVSSFAEANNSTRNTLGHEIGHALTNTFDNSYDSPNQSYIFYSAFQPDYAPDDCNHYRRIKKSTEDYARRTRTTRFPIAPPVSNSTGNLFLRIAP